MKTSKYWSLSVICILAFTSAMISFPIHNVNAQACVPAPTGLVSWWPGDGDAIDIVGGNNGALQNGATFAPGMVGQAFSFDGVDDYVDVGDVDLPEKFTIDAWVRPNNVATFQTIVSKDDGVARSYFFQLEGPLGPPFNIPGGTLAGSVQNANGGFTQYRTSIGVVTTGSWQHVAMVYDGSVGVGQKMQFYVNGVSYPTSVIGPIGSPGAYDSGGTPNDVALSAKVGIFGDAVSSPFDGLIDEVELFNRTLTAAEIQAIYAAGSAGKCKTLNYRLPFVGLKYISNGPGCGTGNKKHEGFTAKAIDYAMVIGTPVYASEAGIIEFVGSVPNKAGKDLSGFGLFIQIRHADGSHSYYAHLSNAVAVEGRNAVKGQLIGYSGASGKAIGHPHLHFQIMDANGNPFPILTLPVTHWYSLDPNDPNYPCNPTPKTLDGYAIGPSVP